MKLKIKYLTENQIDDRMDDYYQRYSYCAAKLGQRDLDGEDFDEFEEIYHNECGFELRNLDRANFLSDHWIIISN